QEGIVWISLENASQQSYVTQQLTNWGVPLANIQFLLTASDSIWMRDYGPSWIYDGNGTRSIIDFDYDRPRPDDDAFPTWLAGHWDMDAYATDLMYEGGNFIADGCGTCMASTRIYEQNAFQYTRQEVDQVMSDYFGCDRMIVLTKMTNDGTGHIDMFCKLLDVDTVLVGQVNSGHQDYAILEGNAMVLANAFASSGVPYEVVRIPMGNNYRTYTNSLILNDKVIVPSYYGGTGLDAQAQVVYQSAMPGHEMVMVDCASIINAGGAVHCITMGVPGDLPPEPTMTPSPTATVISSPAPSPIVSATPEPNHSPIPTPTPESPTPVPSVTPPATGVIVTLEMPGDRFSPGDEVWLRVDLANDGPSVGSAVLVVMLDLEMGMYWFYPGWIQYPPCFDYAVVEIPAGAVSYMILQPFDWPDGMTGVFESAHFYAAILSDDLTGLVSNLTQWDFGWGPE
ncbi:agmatine deiminase family protein, partial [bacterium]|nr:agmatine deiminase family protein [candidate division CSSED10-310 bacterium]